MTDGEKNYRISKDVIYLHTPVWPEGGGQFILGGTLYDAAGQYKQTDLVDGVILDMGRL